MIRECCRKWLLLALILIAAPSALFSGQVTIDFESLSDSTFVSTQFSGLTFSNAIILTAGISLNEFDFPPRSGVNIVSDAGGPISVLFAAPVLSFSAYFTYVVPVTVQGFDGSSALLDSMTSLFANTTVSGGDPGSGPNELLQISSATGFSSVVITGDPSGESFTLDDLTYTTADTGSAPEPSALGLSFAGLTVLLLAAKAGRRC